MNCRLSAVVLTWNEELNIAKCLQSLMDLSDDLVVLDSGSRDRTTSIAAQMGVPVFQNAFTGFGDQRNWAIDNIPHRHDWVLHLDADEQLTPALIHEIRERLETDPAEAGFFISSKLIMGNRWLRFSSGYPVFQVRLFHRRRLRFINHGHGQREKTAGEIGFLREPYLHYAFSKGIQQWFEKHAKYAAAEARQSRSEVSDVLSDFRNCLKFDKTERRRALKRITANIPARSTLRFLELLILKRGLLDGRAGVTYAKMMSTYEAMYSTCCSAIDQGFEV
jgi:glycosyltransferase involved in cell wall biosynthesis